jgi:glycosyltransferase 2 family protein
VGLERLRERFGKGTSKMKRLSHFAFLIGLGLFFYLLIKKIDLPTTLDILRHANLSWLAAAFLFALPEIFFKGLRLHCLASRLKSPLKLGKAIWIYLSGQPLSLVTPGKLGDVVRVFGLSKLGKLSLPSAFSAHVADKVYDLLTLGLLVAIGLINLVIQSQNQIPALAALLGLLLGIGLIFLFLHPEWMRAYIKPLLLSLAPKTLADNIKTHGSEFYSRLLELFNPPQRLAAPFIYSFFVWETTAIRAYCCALALGLPISLSSLVLLLPVIIMVELLPISIMGFGTREAALFILFSSGQVSYSALFSFSILMQIVGPVFFALLGIPAFLQLSSVISKKS